jgi:hypothetical protein
MQSNYSVSELCEKLAVSCSGYHAWESPRPVCASRPTGQGRAANYCCNLLASSRLIRRIVLLSG